MTTVLVNGLLDGTHDWEGKDASAATLPMLCNMPGKIRDESLEAGELGKLEVFARARRCAWRRHDGRRGVEPSSRA
jgi:hypothetical protein